MSVVEGSYQNVYSVLIMAILMGSLNIQKLATLFSFCSQINVKLCGISYGSALFVKTNLSSEKEVQYLFGNYNLLPLNIHKGPS